MPAGRATRRPDDYGSSVNPAAAVVKVRGTFARRALAPLLALLLAVQRCLTGRLGFTLAAAGYAAVAVVFVLFPNSADVPVWDRAGDEIRAGISPYYHVAGPGGFYYGPPWALAFAAVSWLPPVVVHLGITVAELAGLRYLTGSWRGAGFVCLTFPMWREVQVGQLNVLLAVGIAAAVRGDPRAAIVMGAAKLSPLLAIHPRDWRPALATALVLGAVTLPWLGLWGDWAGQLTGSYGANISTPGTQIEIPFLPRLALALGLLALRRPWARTAAAIVAIPALYWPTSPLLLLAFVPLLRDDARRGGAAPMAPR